LLLYSNKAENCFSPFLNLPSSKYFAEEEKKKEREKKTPVGFFLKSIQYHPSLDQQRKNGPL
jgi:hypothetical protein